SRTEHVVEEQRRLYSKCWCDGRRMGVRPRLLPCGGRWRDRGCCGINRWKRNKKVAVHPCPEHLCVQDTRRRAGVLSSTRGSRCANSPSIPRQNELPCTCEAVLDSNLFVTLPSKFLSAFTVSLPGVAGLALWRHLVLSYALAPRRSAPAARRGALRQSCWFSPHAAS